MGPSTSAPTPRSTAVDFRLFPGEVHSLMGENGAGKSTLIKAITGALSPCRSGELPAGRVLEVRLGSPHDAQQLGIRAVYQEIDLVPNISVAENIALGLRAASVRDDRLGPDARVTRASEVLADLGLDHRPRLDPGRGTPWPCSSSWPSRGPSSPTSGCWCSTSRRPAWTWTSAPSCSASSATSSGVASPSSSSPTSSTRSTRSATASRCYGDGKLVGEYLTREFLRIDLVHLRCSGAAPTRSGRARSCTSPTGASSPSSAPARSASAPASARRTSTSWRARCSASPGLLGSGRTELARAITGIDKLGRRHHPHPRAPTRASPGPGPAISLGIVYSSENRRAEGHHRRG